MELRTEELQQNLIIRHKTYQSVRSYLSNNDFLEIETPVLMKSTPEGARDYLVPSRTQKGNFFALPQSPQLFKQILMMSGFDKYYQIVKCFRDEDLRADRQPEFTQLDIELSFVDREEMYSLIEGLMQRVWKDVLNVDIETPFQRMSYYEAMGRFGVDKPDMRFEMELQDCEEIFKDSSFKVFSGSVASGGSVKAINVKGLADLTQGELRKILLTLHEGFPCLLFQSNQLSIY